jgi:hypothetical protein
MTHQRVAPRPILLAWLLTLAILTALVLLPGPARGATRPISPLTWRPGWLPGETETGLAEIAPVWAWPVHGARASGLFIAIDPVTHRPVAPTLEQRRVWAAGQAAQDALLAPTRPLTVQSLPNGGKIVHLNGAYRSYSIARRDAKGRIVTDCVPDPAVARETLTQPVATPPPTNWEEK